MCGCKGGPGPVGAIGPELAQQRASRVNVATTMAVAAQGQGRADASAQFAGDVRSPQRIIRTRQFVDDIAAGLWPMLPGRANPAGWDGEPGPAAPGVV